MVHAILARFERNYGTEINRRTPNIKGLELTAASVRSYVAQATSRRSRLAFDRDKMRNKLHEANRKRWDAASESWARGADSRGLWRRCPTEPELVLCDWELAHLGDIAGKRVCVLGSGDNQVAFALAGMEARVTSVDISQRQLDVAKRRAEELRLPMSFLRADVTDLSKIGSAVFDAVYTGGHAAVWVSDLNAYYVGHVWQSSALISTARSAAQARACRVAKPQRQLLRRGDANARGSHDVDLGLRPGLCQP